MGGFRVLGRELVLQEGRGNAGHRRALWPCKPKGEWTEWRSRRGGASGAMAQILGSSVHSDISWTSHGEGLAGEGGRGGAGTWQLAGHQQKR